MTNNFFRFFTPTSVDKFIIISNLNFKNYLQKYNENTIKPPFGLTEKSAAQPALQQRGSHAQNGHRANYIHVCTPLYSMLVATVNCRPIVTGPIMSRVSQYFVFASFKKDFINSTTTINPYM
jgi:hypothetical protein